MKLNLGSGISGLDALNIITHEHDDWKSVDICQHYTTDECYDISKGIRESNNSVEQIWMGDFFEHLLRLDAKFVVKECYRVLQPGGKLQISVPDMTVVMPIWLAADGDDSAHVGLIWGDQDELYRKNEIPSVHKAGYTEVSLKKLFKEAGFTTINRTNIHGVWFELALEMYK